MIIVHIMYDYFLRILLVTNFFYQISTNVMQTLVTMVVRVITPTDRLSAHARLDTMEIHVKTVRTFESVLLNNH